MRRSSYAWRQLAWEVVWAVIVVLAGLVVGWLDYSRVSPRRSPLSEWMSRGSGDRHGKLSGLCRR